MKFLTVLVTMSLLLGCKARPSDDEAVRAVIESAEKGAESRDVSDVLEYVASSYVDTWGMDKHRLKNFLSGYFLAHSRLELLVKIESLEFPVDGVAQAVLSITTVEFTDPDMQRLKVEFRRSAGQWQVVRADLAA